MRIDADSDRDLQIQIKLLQYLSMKYGKVLKLKYSYQIHCYLPVYRYRLRTFYAQLSVCWLRFSLHLALFRPPGSL
jgi:hypothetical protein